MGNSTSSYNLHCYNFTENQMNFLNISRGVLGGVCAVIAAGILFLLLYSKTYRSVLQRMFLYLTISTFILEIFHTMQIERQFSYARKEQFCSALGFFVQYSYLVNCLLTLGITVFSMFTVFMKLLSNPFERVTKTKELQIVLECLFLLATLAVPFTFSWVPFKDRNYGLAGPFCWIRGINETCTTVGLRDQMVYYGIVLSIGLVSLVAEILLSFLHCRIAYKYRTVRSQQGKLVCQTLLLMCFLTIHVVAHTAGLLSRWITDKKHKGNFTLWIANAAGLPVSSLIIPLGFLVYLKVIGSQTVNCGKCRKLRRRIHYEGCLKACCMRRRDTNDYTEWLNTNPSSHPINIPSHTHWSVPYTGQFTNTESQNQL